MDQKKDRNQEESEISRSTSVSRSDNSTSTLLSSPVEGNTYARHHGFSQPYSEAEVRPNISESSCPYSFFFDEKNFNDLNYDLKDRMESKFLRVSSVSKQRAYKAVLHRHQVAVTHRRRRLLSQRSLGERMTLQDFFFLRRYALKEDSDDTILFSTFSNGAMFYNLLYLLSSSAKQRLMEYGERSQGEKPEESVGQVSRTFCSSNIGGGSSSKSRSAALYGSVDEVLCLVNPYFQYQFESEKNCIPISETASPGLPCSSSSPPEEEEWARESPWVHEALQREAAAEHPFLSYISFPASRPSRGSHGGSSRRSHNCDRASENREEKSQNTAGKRGGSSSSNGVMKASLNAWELHLEEELEKEGETIESYRQKAAARVSEIEKLDFLEQATWNEYAMEMELQERQRKAQERRKRCRDDL